MSACQNSPAATACQYDDYIVHMPYFYYLMQTPDRLVKTC